MQTASTLLTSTGHIDTAACRALTAHRCRMVRGLPRYNEIFAGYLNVTIEEARQEQRRRGLGPDERLMADLQDRLAHTDYLPFAEAEEVRPKLLKQIADVRAAQASYSLAAE